MEGMDTIHIDVIDVRKIGVIKPLWEELNRHHTAKSPYFVDFFRKLTFEKRAGRMKNAEMKIRVTVARDIAGNRIVGYCIATINDSDEGEIDSIYIEPEYRRRRIGDRLMKNACDWMDAEGVVVRTMAVIFGNDEVYGFYMRHGFFPAHVVFYNRPPGVAGEA